MRCIKVISVSTALLFTGSLASAGSAGMNPTLMKPDILLPAAGWTVARGEVFNRCGERAKTDITVHDYNRDGVKDATVMETSGCYRPSRARFVLLTQRNRQWRILLATDGTAIWKKTAGWSRAGTKGWFDIEISGNGACPAIWRFDGQRYRFHHGERDGRRCRI